MEFITRQTVRSLAKLMMRRNRDDSAPLVHQLESRFAEHMRNSGQKRKACVDEFMNDHIAGDDDVEHDQLHVTESEMRAWVREVGFNCFTQLVMSLIEKVYAEAAAKNCQVIITTSCFRDYFMFNLQDGQSLPKTT